MQNHLISAQLCGIGMVNTKAKWNIPKVKKGRNNRGIYLNVIPILKVYLLPTLSLLIWEPIFVLLYRSRDKGH